MKLNLKGRVVAHMTYKSWRSVPHVSFVYNARAKGLLGECERMGVSVNTMILKIICDAIKCAPKVNSSIKFNRITSGVLLRENRKIDVAMPVEVQDGQIVSVRLRDVGAKSVIELQNYIDDLLRRLRNCNVDIPLRAVAVKHNFFARFVLGKASRGERKIYKQIPDCDKILPDDLDNGTVTISNVGSLYKGLNGTFGLIEIVPPQIFAVGVSAIQADGTLPLCLCFDHRAMNFGDIVPFIRKLDFLFDALNNNTK